MGFSAPLSLGSLLSILKSQDSPSFHLFPCHLWCLSEPCRPTMFTQPPGLSALGQTDEPWDRQTTHASIDAQRRDLSLHRRPNLPPGRKQMLKTLVLTSLKFWAQPSAHTISVSELKPPEYKQKCQHFSGCLAGRGGSDQLFLMYHPSVEKKK